MTKDKRLILNNERILLCREIGTFRDRLFRAGLVATSQAMDVACKHIGYELEEIMTKDNK